MKLAAAFMALALAAVVWAYASADGTPTSQHIASKFATPYPCLTAIVYNDTVRPTATVINSLGTPYEPWGYTLILRADHPLYQSIKDGTAASVWAC